MPGTPPLPSSLGSTPLALDLTAEELQTLEQLQGQFSNLRVRRLIDEGASSKVWEGDWAGARVVIKVLREEEALRSFLGEVNIWRQLRHPCVCSLLGVCMFEQRPAMVLEYLIGGSLHDLLHNPSPGDEAAQLGALLVARIVAEVASGVAYLHYNGVMHRDIKTANVLLDEARHAKVTDFGISTRFGRADYTAETGTYRQMAPEVILHKPYNYKCDVYSYGVLVWETLHRQVPFTGFAPLQAAFAVAMEQARPPINLSSELHAYGPLIERCWATDPTQRPGMDQVVRATAECFASIEAAATAAEAQREGSPEQRSSPDGSLSTTTGDALSKLSLMETRMS